MDQPHNPRRTWLTQGVVAILRDVHPFPKKPEKIRLKFDPDSKESPN
jgi:hypothetical protein